MKCNCNKQDCKREVKCVNEIENEYTKDISNMIDRLEKQKEDLK